MRERQQNFGFTPQPDRRERSGSIAPLLLVVAALATGGIVTMKKYESSVECQLPDTPLLEDIGCAWKGKDSFAAPPVVQAAEEPRTQTPQAAAAPEAQTPA